MAKKRPSKAKARRGLMNLEAEVYVSLLRTADHLARGAEELLKPVGLSGTQYNVLRILRGAGRRGLSCREVGERMITRDPDVTRLLDRLERRGLVSRSRERADRRVITTRITPKGLALLAGLDDSVAELHRRQLGPLGRERLRTLLNLLELVRTG